MATYQELEVLKDVPGYKAILKALIKSQIQQLVELLSTEAQEEAVLLIASITDGSLSHLGSQCGRNFLSSNEDVKSKFLGFCLKRHHTEPQHVQPDNSLQCQKGSNQQSTGMASHRSEPFHSSHSSQRSQRQVSDDHTPSASISNNYPSNNHRYRQTADSCKKSDRNNQSGEATSHQTCMKQELCSPRLTDSFPHETASQPGDRTLSEISIRQDMFTDAAVEMDVQSSATVTSQPHAISESWNSMQGSALGEASVMSESSVSGACGADSNETIVKVEELTDCLYPPNAGDGTGQQNTSWSSNTDIGSPEGMLSQSSDVFNSSPSLSFSSLPDSFLPYTLNTNVTSGRPKGSRKYTKLPGGMFRCDLCLREFRRSDYLYRHIMIHTGQKPYMCKLCKLTFRQKSHLNQHMVSKHPELFTTS